ncbi:helix-turn-helix domain-containing protein [Streptomyces clavuligerus]|uniref:helix-turn-helix domain-containing protein n=1 Tax=Streptomyces clavuligerus TaxID=1901 RepID=UPI0001800AA6|nr:transcriptional regulator [Streptomyces clavuligerus]
MLVPPELLHEVMCVLAVSSRAGPRGPGGRAELVERISAFIDRRLGDPALGPGGIAAHHHMSVRSLHLLFRGQPETVSAMIRRRRLERCRADLADPRQRSRTITEIAARWGFRHPAQFSRAFRAAYGTAPRELRPGRTAGRPPARSPAVPPTPSPEPSRDSPPVVPGRTGAQMPADAISMMDR